MNYYTSSVNTMCAVAKKKYLDVPVFIILVFTSPRLILIDPLLMMGPGYRTVSHWLYDLPPTLTSFRRELKAHLFHEAYPPQYLLLCLRKRFLMPTLFCPWTYDILFTLRNYCTLDLIQIKMKCLFVYYYYYYYLCLTFGRTWY